jgi:hypothetical protein
MRRQNGAPRVQDIADKLNLWIAAIERFIIVMKARLPDQGP